jgi:hypothetical protein
MSSTTAALLYEEKVTYEITSRHRRSHILSSAYLTLFISKGLIIVEYLPEKIVVVDWLYYLPPAAHLLG